MPSASKSTPEAITTGEDFCNEEEMAAVEDCAC